MTANVKYKVISENGAMLFLPPYPAGELANVGEPDVMATSTGPLYPIGTLAWFPGIGKKYRYAKAGGICGNQVLLMNGHHTPDDATSANTGGFYGKYKVDNTAVAIDAGVTELCFTDTVNRAVNFFEGAHVTYFDGARNTWFEPSYVISGPAQATVTPWYNTKVQLAEATKNSHGTSDDMEIWCNPYSNIKAAASSGYETYMGVAGLPVASGSYFWLQTAGPVFIVPNGWSTLCPGYAANSRVCMSISGILTTQAAQGAGHQVIGTLLAIGSAGYGDAFLNMNLDLGH